MPLLEALWRTVSPNASLDASCRRLGFDIAFLCYTLGTVRLPAHRDMGGSAGDTNMIAAWLSATLAITQAFN